MDEMRIPSLWHTDLPLPRWYVYAERWNKRDETGKCEFDRIFFA